jgi:alanine-glyoxylate transaminase/serine-glyoxylate transaminase/serine-pyruvate transaminase
MIENVQRAGGVAVVVDDTWGEPVSPQKVEDAFKAHPEARLLAFVHAETSTGARSDAQTLATIARAHGALSIVDAVTSLAGCELRVDAWGLDAVYSGSQKCLSCTPGLSPVTFSAAALERIKARKTKVQSWFMDLNLVLDYWNSAKRTYHHTAPINSLYGLHESLVQLAEEGIENAWERHARLHRMLRAGFEASGLSFLVAEEWRLPQLNAIHVPDGVNDAEVRSRLLADYNLEIGAGLGPLAGKVWRFGLMGHSCREENVLLCLDALASTLTRLGRPTDGDAAFAAARAAIAG